jgi:hypothetical protein
MADRAVASAENDRIEAGAVLADDCRDARRFIWAAQIDGKPGPLHPRHRVVKRFRTPAAPRIDDGENATDGVSRS